MRIGVDATCWANGRGYGRFTRHLLRAMVALAPDDEFICFLDAESAAGFDLEGPNVRRVVVEMGHAPTTAAAADGYRSPADMLRLTRAVWREKPDLFFSPSVYTYFPLPPGQRAVVTVHDAIAERFPELTLPSARARLFWRLKVGLALRQARLVLTVSDFAASELVEVLGIPRARLRVSGEAPAAAFQPSGDAAEPGRAAAARGVPTGAPWFTYVGGFNPHKHVDALVRAHAAVSRGRGNPPHLLLVGTIDKDVFHGDQAGIRAAVREAGTEALVHWTGFVPDEELRHLHSGAVALVLPSACEGFGLPAVEAAACGTPVIATTASPLPGLLEGGGIFVKPGDAGEVEAAMRRLLDDAPLRAAMGRIARQKAGELSWDRGAGAALAAIREAAA
ncbi:MAG: glycosyltransferase family 4 protein [Gemmatimonadota bacterium]|nr:glycosyltransferase family 4 protein [Gemmatimonadota bacterium]MDH4348998.1 glycosyltransferase family 4 protein [Gemmatimonadota bacterium]MDH5282783.1 glycosyltransferase family 4 protein [Gemmatimonadota bacterium]